MRERSSRYTTTVAVENMALVITLPMIVSTVVLRLGGSSASCPRPPEMLLMIELMMKARTNSPIPTPKASCVRGSLAA